MTSDTIIITPKVFKLSSVQSALPQLGYQKSYENEELRLVRGSRIVERRVSMRETMREQMDG